MNYYYLVKSFYNNKKGLSKNGNCPASIDVTVKLSTMATKKKQPFIKVV